MIDNFAPAGPDPTARSPHCNRETKPRRPRPSRCSGLLPLCVLAICCFSHRPAHAEAPSLVRIPVKGPAMIERLGARGIDVIAYNRDGTIDVVAADKQLDYILTLGVPVSVIGTPDMAIAQIERLMKQSNGGFGAYLMLAHNWADPTATRKSYELIARHVMPQFQGHHTPTMDAAKRARKARPELAETHMKAVEAMGEKYAAEKAARN